MGKETDIQMQEVHKVPNKNPKRPTLRHIIIKTSKVKDKGKIIKTTKEKQLIIMYSATLFKTISSFLSRTLKARRERCSIFKD